MKSYPSTQPLAWQSMPEGRSKYAAYLASREWALLKEAVKERSRGFCERCRVAPGTQTHHQTYERKYAEWLSDLLHVCGPCHEFLSGKSHHDPRPTRKLYLAGKISSNDWRLAFHPEINDRSWDDKDGLSIAIQGEVFKYTGPFFIPNTCKHCSPHGPSTHGSLIASEPAWRGEMAIRADACCGRMSKYGGFEGKGHDSPVSGSQERTVTLCLHVIRQSDVVFAWINRKDCFGTIAEIGYAVAMEKEVWIGAPNEHVLRHMWFMCKMVACVHLAPTPLDCFIGCHQVLAAYPWVAQHVRR